MKHPGLFGDGVRGMRGRDLVTYLNVGDRGPESIPATKLITAIIKNTASNVWPISREIPATLPAPKMMDMRAKTKNARAALSIENLLRFKFRTTL